MKKQDELRPLTSRALTSAIDTLRPHLAEAHVLDLFAGAGRFGLAALQENAADCDFVEKSKQSCAHIESEIKKLKLPGQVHCADVFRYLETATRKYDVVFADPPFPAWNTVFSETLQRGVSRVLSPGGIFLVKYPKQVVAFEPVSSFECWKKTQFGESLLLYFNYVE